MRFFQIAAVSSFFFPLLLPLYLPQHFATPLSTFSSFLFFYLSHTQPSVYAISLSLQFFTYAHGDLILAGTFPSTSIGIFPLLWPRPSPEFSQGQSKELMTITEQTGHHFKRKLNRIKLLFSL